MEETEVQTGELNFQFKEGDNFVDDKERSDALKKILIPKEKQPKLPQDYQIDMKVTLESLVEQDLSNDGKVMKYIINQGNEEEDLVPDKSTIKIRFELRLENGTLKDLSMTRSNIHRINLNSSKPIIKGLKFAFLSMKVGEKAWFKLSDDWNFNADQQTQDQSLVLFYKIEMIECIRPTNIQNNIKEDRIVFLQTIQTQGKDLFKQNQFDRAFKLYQKGINYIDYWPKNLKNDPSIEKILKDYKLLFVNNQVQCLIEKKDFKEATKLLLQIKDQTRGNVIELKTLYRLAKCYYNEQEYERSLYSLNDIERLVTLDEDQQREIQKFKEVCCKKINDEVNEFQNKAKKCKLNII